jgi:hypothetical protein
MGNNIHIHLEVTEWEGVDWIDLAEDKEKWCALVRTVMEHSG